MGSPRCPSGMQAKAGGCLGPTPKCPQGMIGIGATRFHLGTNREGRQWRGSRPVRQVKVNAFCIDRTEVTVAAYKQCVEAGACTKPHINIPGEDWATPTCNQLRADRMTHPVNCIAWEQADTYCRWAGKRLPSEEEWQLAAGRMDGRRFAWGDAPPGPDKANLRGSDGEVDAPLYDEPDGWEDTAPVGSFPKDASPFGALDMGGNVNEWSATRSGKLVILLGGDYSLRVAKHQELRARAGSMPDDFGPMDGVRCLLER